MTKKQSWKTRQTFKASERRRDFSFIVPEQKCRLSHVTSRSLRTNGDENKSCVSFCEINWISLTTCLCCFQLLKKRCSRIYIFIHFLHLGQKKSVGAACRKFTHCYLVTADKLPPPPPPPSLDCWPETFSMHFLPKDKCKFSLKKEKQFSVRHKLQTHQRARPFLLLSDNCVYMHVWTKTNLVKSQRGKLLVWNKNLKHQDSFLSLSLFLFLFFLPPAV